MNTNFSVNTLTNTETGDILNLVVASNSTTTSALNTVTSAITTVTETNIVSFAIDYSPFYQRIAVAMEGIAASIGKIAEASTTTGIRTYGAYDWAKPVEMISWYGQGLGLSNVSTSSISQLVTIINSLTNNVSKFE